MLESMPVVLLLSTLLGFLTGLGIGGGSLLILWLTVVLELEPNTARSINLLFFLPSAFVSCLFRLRQGTIPGKKILPAILAGGCAALVFSWLGSLLELTVLKKIFGGLLILTGLRELFYRPRNAR